MNTGDRDRRRDGASLPNGAPSAEYEQADRDQLRHALELFDQNDMALAERIAVRSRAPTKICSCVRVGAVE